jgi:hypothetical protein
MCHLLHIMRVAHSISSLSSLSQSTLKILLLSTLRPCVIESGLSTPSLRFCEVPQDGCVDQGVWRGLPLHLGFRMFPNDVLGEREHSTEMLCAFVHFTLESVSEVVAANAIFAATSLDDSCAAVSMPCLAL